MAQDKENLKRKREAESVEEEKETSSSKDPKQAKKQGQTAPISSETPPDLLALARQKNWPAIEKLIEQKKITPELLTAIIEEEGDDQGVNTLWFLAVNKQWDIINKLLSHITPQALESAAAQGTRQGVNTLWCLAVNEQWGIIDKLCSKVTPKALEEATKQGHNQGINTLWSLAVNEQWGIIDKLCSKVTSKALESTPTQGTCQDINTLWFLAHHKQWDIINKLLSKVTSKALEEGEGVNTLQFLAGNEQWGIINELLSKVTPKALEEATKQGDNQGITALWFLADNEQWGIIKTLVDQRKITTAALLGKNLTDTNPQNALVLLAINNQWDLIKKLIPEINTQLLVEKASTKSFLEHLLEHLLTQASARVIEFLERLLDAPLKPLALVPWEAFKIQTDDIMLALLQEEKWDTIKRLIKAGVALPARPKGQQLLKTRRTTWALNKDPASLPKDSTPLPESYSKMVALYKRYAPPPKDHKSEYPASNTPLSNNAQPHTIKDFDHTSQMAFWHWKALETIKEETKCLGIVTRVAEQLPNEIMQRILFYTSGDQQGVRYAFTNESTKTSITLDERYRRLIEEYRKKGSNLLGPSSEPLHPLFFEELPSSSEEKTAQSNTKNGGDSTLHTSSNAAAARKVGQFAVKSEAKPPKMKEEEEEVEVAPVALSETESSSSSSSSSSTLQMDTSK
jgi:hypothetical protein